MKKDIHPQYYPEATVKCACGNTFKVGATQKFIETETCSQCHSFYTGKEKNLDKVGQVQKFKARLAKQKAKEEKVKEKREENKEKAMKKKEGSQKSKKKENNNDEK
jgi:large subunit ribosomal protein L31